MNPQKEASTQRSEPRQADSSSRPLIDDESRERFDEDGVIVLRGVFSDWVAPLREAVEEVIANPGPLARDHAPDASGGRFFTDVYMWRRHPVFRKFVEQSVMAELAAALLSSREVLLYNEHLLVKEPGADAPTPWHQDQPYFRFTGIQNCSIWIALDPVTGQNGAMRFAAGSHRWGRWFNPASFREGREVSIAFDGPAPDLDRDPGNTRIIDFDLQPGDCTIHHGLTLHGAPANRSASQRRRGLSYRLTGDDCRYRPNSYSSPLPEEPDLATGAGLECDLFMRVWPPRIAQMPRPSRERTELREERVGAVTRR